MRYNYRTKLTRLGRPWLRLECTSKTGKTLSLQTRGIEPRHTMRLSRAPALNRKGKSRHRGAAARRPGTARRNQKEENVEKASVIDVWLCSEFQITSRPVPRPPTQRHKTALAQALRQPRKVRRRPEPPEMPWRILAADTSQAPVVSMTVGTNRTPRASHHHGCVERWSSLVCRYAAARVSGRWTAAMAMSSAAGNPDKLEICSDAQSTNFSADSAHDDLTDACW